MARRNRKAGSEGGEEAKKSDPKKRRTPAVSQLVGRVLTEEVSGTPADWERQAAEELGREMAGSGSLSQDEMVDLRRAEQEQDADMASRPVESPEEREARLAGARLGPDHRRRMEEMFGSPAR